MREDGLDEVVDEVEGADGVAGWVADEDVGGGEVGGEVELSSGVFVSVGDVRRGRCGVTCRSRGRGRRAITSCRAFL